MTSFGLPFSSLALWSFIFKRPHRQNMQNQAHLFSWRWLIGPGGSFGASPHPGLNGTRQMLSLKSLIAFVLVILWAWTSVFPFSHVQSAPPSCYSCWLTSPKSLWAQENSKYVHFDTHVSLYSPGQHSPVFSISFILNLHLSLRNFGSLTIYSAPLNSVLLPLSWLSFSIFLFSLL